MVAGIQYFGVPELVYGFENSNPPSTFVKLWLGWWIPPIWNVAKLFVGVSGNTSWAAWPPTKVKLLLFVDWSLSVDPDKPVPFK